MAKLDEGWASCQREMDTLLNLVHARNAEEFAEKVNAHEHHDQIAKEWERVKQDLRMYAGGEEEFETLWHALETGQYDQWMEKHNELSRKVEEETKELGELQRSQGAIDNEIFRLAGDDSMTAALQKKKNRSRTAVGFGRMAHPHVYRRTSDPAQSIYESGRQPEIMKMANEFLKDMTMGKYALHISENGKDIYIEDSMHGVKTEKSGPPAPETRFILPSAWPWLSPSESTLNRCPSFWTISSSASMKNGSAKPSASSWILAKNSRSSSSPAMKEPCTLQKK